MSQKTTVNIYEVELREIDRSEKIPAGALHSTNGGLTIRPLANPQETVGQTPADFSEDRKFYEILIAIKP